MQRELENKKKENIVISIWKLRFKMWYFAVRKMDFLDWCYLNITISFFFEIELTNVWTFICVQKTAFIAESHCLTLVKILLLKMVNSQCVQKEEEKNKSNKNEWVSSFLY